MIQGSARVIDGDTLQVDGKRVRLFAIDAPEIKQTCTDKRGFDYTCGRAAARALQTAVGHSPVLCTSRQLDQYGRTVAECHNSQRQDLGHLMVAKGHAIAYSRYSNKYVLDETKAKQQKLGIWQGKFEIPATWRKKQHDLQSDKSDL
ncbi:hypothetical protein WJX73_009878 [Symbiochloris irregularis]|uniref:TNase-like domain-containing protein n=1 Tax=Symbiochloris irregularis TaxID=706552 RepID=A0AAW1Q0T2_9CHLO